MRRDSIFYKLFAQSPATLFDLLPNPPANAAAYRFDSVAIKEPRFEIDGVFLPPDDTPGPVYFCEIQFQKDEQLYERILAETTLYFYRNRPRFNDWQVVVIYPSARTEQSDLHPHRWLLASDQLHRIYLDELGDIRQLPLWLAIMVLTTLPPSISPAEARHLITRVQQETPPSTSRAIIELVTTIMSYQFKQLSRQEVETMLDITFEETRVYQEIKEEATQKGLEQGLQEGLQQGLQQGLQEGRQEGRQEEALQLILRLLKKRFGDLGTEAQNLVSQLPLLLLEELTEAQVDFTNTADLQAWLAAKSSETL